MLVTQGIISPEQLADALRIQKHEKNVRIGSLLVELGHVTELQLADLIADQLRLPLADFSTLDLSQDAVAKVPKDLAIKHRCLPWTIDGRDLHLIMADPTDVAAMDAVRFHTGLRVKPIVGPEGEVVAAIDRAYNTDESVANFADSVQLTDQLAVMDEADADPLATSDEDLQRAALSAPVTKLVNAIFADAIRLGASDIHIEPQQKGTNLRYRVDGALRQIMTMPKRTHPRVVSRIKIAAHMDIAERRRPQDGRTRIVLNGETFDLRISTLPTADGEKVVIRILARNRAKVSLEQLGFESDTLDTFKTLLRRPQGLILVTGPTGSGKTSTLYAALNFLTEETTNIVTIEDPVEYRLPGINQVAVWEKAGLTFAAGLRSILRQDPNIVMVGEIRDAETAQVAFHAAQTGHLVLSTLHTNDAPSTVARLVEIGIPSYLVASSVVAVLAQRLVRTLCSCKTVLPDGRATPAGCEQCRQTGYRGRMAIHELLRLTPRVRNTLMAHASTDPLRQAAIASGMRTMFEDGERKVARGFTTVEEIKRVVPPPEVDDTVVETPVLSIGRSAPSAPADGFTSSADARVLIVDDDPILSGTIRQAFANESCEVLAAPPPAALRTILEHAPNLVITELTGASGTDGIELLRRLRSEARAQGVAVMVITRGNDVHAEIRALDAGADDCLRQPITADLVLRRSRRLLAVGGTSAVA
jgi:type IV pilus assembly protein PilB